jgi:hypothetical protein
MQKNVGIFFINFAFFVKSRKGLQLSNNIENCCKFNIINIKYYCTSKSSLKFG